VNNKPMPAVVEKALRSLDLYQPWVMFIQTPPQRSWYVARGITRSEEVIDIYRDRKGEPSLGTPKYASEGGWDPNYRWRKYVMNLWYPSLSQLRPYYVDYLCRKWNSTHEGPDQLEKITITYVTGGGPLNHSPEQYPWSEFDCRSTY
jgi:hypothetical protein